MTDTPDFGIINIFSVGLNVELTINQLAARLGKSYAYTNLKAHQMIGEGVLKKKVVGASILCSLDFQNEKTISLLVYSSMDKANKEAQVAAKSSFAASDLIFRYGNQTMTISSKTQKSSGANLTYEDLLKKIPSFDLSKIIILRNAEQFWRLAASITK